MKVEVLENYLNKHFRNIEENLSGYEEDMKPERLRRLRVSIKKIRALLGFITKTYHTDYDISCLKRVFKRAGELRDDQLYVQLLEDQASPSDALLSHLQHQKNGRKGAFKVNSSLYQEEVRQMQETLSIPSEKLDKKRVEKYFEKRLKKARQDIGDKDRKKAHRFRKHIKKVLYLYRALPKKLKKKIQLDTGYLKKLQKKAGDWHDTHLALEYVSHYAQTPRDVENRSHLEAKEQKQFEQLLKKVKMKRLSVG
jgi:CHAD domain-containing protein